VDDYMVCKWVVGQNLYKRTFMSTYEKHRNIYVPISNQKLNGEEGRAFWWQMDAHRRNPGRSGSDMISWCNVVSSRQKNGVKLDIARQTAYSIGANFCNCAKIG